MSDEGDRLREIATQLDYEFTVRTPMITQTRAVHLQPSDVQLFIDAANCLEAPPPEPPNGNGNGGARHAKHK